MPDRNGHDLAPNRDSAREREVAMLNEEDFGEER
jgi:hypothetical protein